MPKASVAIFAKKAIEIPKVRESCPEVPDEVFLAAKRIMDTKGEEMLKTSTGMYFVRYSNSGPFQTQMGMDEWLPVSVTYFTNWNSGGIRQSEMSSFNSDTDQRDEHIYTKS